MGLYLIDRWFSGRGLKNVSFIRLHDSHAFIGETIPIRLEVHNLGFLPVVWMRLQDNLPIDLAPLGSFKRVITLGVRGQVNFEYELFAQRRGIYWLGPVAVSSGNIFGFGQVGQRTGFATKLLVYPSIRPMTKFSLPSRSPLGDIFSPQSIMLDPTRVRGKRDYQTGDSFRQIDWKTTASIGKIQVKQYEPTINILSVICLNLNLLEYEFRRRIEAVELAIVTAASIANWIVQQRQAVGMITNGVFTEPNENRISFSSRKGKAHLMRMLEVLAQIQSSETDPFEELVSDNRSRFSWGTTMILITGSVSDQLFHEIYLAKKVGIKPVLITIGNIPNLDEIRDKVKIFNTPFKHIRSELDLETWEDWQ